jgi:hypothetical protein
MVEPDTGLSSSLFGSPYALFNLSVPVLKELPEKGLDALDHIGGYILDQVSRPMPVG